MSVVGGLVLGVDGTGAIGFPNGRRLVRWLGYRSILDEPDPLDPEHRTVRYLLQLTGRHAHYPPSHRLYLKAMANHASNFGLVPGHTGRDLGPGDDLATRLSRTYRWVAANGYVAELDGLDADALLEDPSVGPEFAYADVEDPRLLPRLPTPEARAAWRREMHRGLRSTDKRAIDALGSARR